MYRPVAVDDMVPDLDIFKALSVCTSMFCLFGLSNNPFILLHKQGQMEMLAGSLQLGKARVCNFNKDSYTNDNGIEETSLIDAELEHRERW